MKGAPLSLGEDKLTISELYEIAHSHRAAILSDGCRSQMEASVKVLEEALARGATVYGVTTGFGDSCESHAGEPPFPQAGKLKRLHKD